jgi:hypothetical protein
VRIQKTGALKTSVAVLSPFKSAGVITCVVGVYGEDDASPLEIRRIAAADVFPLELPDLRLDAGRYTVRLELLLTEICPVIRQNPAGSFGLEVTPVTASVAVVVSGDAGGIGDAEKNALVQSLRQGIETYGVPVRLHPPDARLEEQSGGSFTITLALRKPPPVPPLNRTLVICDTALAFSLNGSVLASSAKRITEMDVFGAAREARKFIEANPAFFQNVTLKLSQ